MHDTTEVRRLRWLLDGELERRSEIGAALGIASVVAFVRRRRGARSPAA